MVYWPIGPDLKKKVYMDGDPMIGADNILSGYVYEKGKLQVTDTGTSQY